MTANDDRAPETQGFTMTPEAAADKASRRAKLAAVFLKAVPETNPESLECIIDLFEEMGVRAKGEPPPAPSDVPSPEEVQVLIAEECAAIQTLLIGKNRAYGNSALDPVRIFSRASAREQILVRLDDKLSRLKRGSTVGEDVILDTIGYLILLRVLDRIAAMQAARTSSQAAAPGSL
jgi:hypothetical protein